jgi:hypothetical protein
MGLLSGWSAGSGAPEPVRRVVPGKVLAWARAADGTVLAGTRDALHLVRVADEDLESLPWEQVQRADWDADERTLTVERLEDYGRPVTPRGFRLDEPGSLLALLRERVSASIVVQQRVVVEGTKGLVVIARRPPSRRGAISWAYEFDVGVDPTDPVVMARAEQGLREAQESLGLG